MWIERSRAQQQLQESLRRSPVTLLTGPRQAGKSSLARHVTESEPSDFFDLEDPRDLARLADPMLALSGRSGLIVIDEAQLQPDLFQVLRVLVDKDPRPGRFLILGSASPELVGLSSETLAGRVTFNELGGFGLEDIGADMFDTWWYRGGYPSAFLAENDDDAGRWLDDYIATFLARDLGSLGFGMSPTTMRRFWAMLAHYHGQTWNGAELARSIDVSQSTVRRYVDALTDALVVRQLPPWFENLKKRQVKSPRVLIRDAGLLHRLLGIRNREELLVHPRLGASWEGLVVEHLASVSEPGAATFWSTHSGAEVDLRLAIGTKVIGVEVKRTSAPTVTRSMRSAIESIGLDHLFVVHGGELRFPLSSDVTALPAVDVLRAKSEAELLEYLP